MLNVTGIVVTRKVWKLNMCGGLFSFAHFDDSTKIHHISRSQVNCKMKDNAIEP